MNAAKIQNISKSKAGKYEKFRENMYLPNN